MCVRGQNPRGAHVPFSMRETGVESPSVRVVVERDHMESHDMAEVEDLINHRYVDHRPRMLTSPRRLRFRSQAAWAGGLTVDHMTYGASVVINADPFDTIIALGVVDGRFDLTPADTHTGVYADAHGRAAKGDSLVYPLGTPLNMFLDQVTLDITQIPAAAVTRLAARAGVDPADFRFDGMEPVSAALNRHWMATAAYLSRSFAGPEPAVSHPLVLAGVVEVAAAAVLTVFPNPTMTLHYATGPGRVAPAVVRRAVAFIDAHAAGPITLEDVAAAAGVTVRGLQAAFARHRDTTPTGYLRRVRMERAHRDLLAGDRLRGDTVAAIARRWGFTAPGRFAIGYRRTYGRSPGETLET